MRWRIRQDGTTWSVINPAGEVVSRGHRTYQAALANLPRTSFAMADPTVVAPPGDPMMETAFVRWESDAAFVDQWTSDGRRLTGEGRVRPFPLPLMFQDETEVEHFGAELVGWIDGATLNGGTWRFTGAFDADNDDAAEAMATIAARGTFGVSIDVGDRDCESVCIGVDDTNVCTEWGMDFIDYELMGLTMTPFPAFQNARIWLADSPPADSVAPAPQPTVVDNPEEPIDLLDLLLYGSADAPRVPPATWFSDPGIGDPEHPLMVFNDQGCALGVPLQITDDGRVFGHLATWGTCHIGYPDQCVQPPGSPSSYAYFRTGYVQTDDGAQVPTGVLTMGTGHAPLHMNAREAAAHYDDSGTAWAQVSAGEDNIGVWVAGWVLPTTTAEQVQLARALSPSGDWRSIGGNLELIAALSVNVPGFPVQRGLAASAQVPEVARPRFHRAVDGAALALVASGIVPHQGSDPQELRIRELEATVAVLMRRTDPLLASAQEAIVARVRR